MAKRGGKRTNKEGKRKRSASSAPATQLSLKSLTAKERREVQSFEQLLQSLERKAQSPKSEPGVWETIKEIASDLYQGGKMILSDLGLDPGSALGLLNLL
jgi:DNA-binding transcriptional regulator GbsR (MarR family)